MATNNVIKSPKGAALEYAKHSFSHINVAPTGALTVISTEESSARISALVPRNFVRASVPKKM